LPSIQHKPSFAEELVELGKSETMLWWQRKSDEVKENI
jgi:hypothetical protein